MNRLHVLTIAVLSLVALPCSAEIFHAETPLTAAVERFNTRAVVDPIGKAQPPLTEDEVVAAIRGWIRKHHPVPDKYYQAFQKVTETLTLPAGSRLDFTTGWKNYNGYDYEVWWVSLSINDPEKPHSDPATAESYTFRIRDRKISSRSATSGNTRRALETKAGGAAK